MVEEAELNINGRFLDSRHKAKKGNTGYLVPLRLVGENMGAEVIWRPERGVIVLKKRGSVYEFNAGSSRVVVNGRRQRLPELVRTYHGHAFAPAEFLAEALEAKVYFSQDTGTLALLRKEPALTGRRIVLDPAHGGTEYGAVVNDLLEKELVLDIVARTNYLLSAAGSSVYQTREIDENLDQRERGLIAKNLEANLLVTVHINSSVSEHLEGIEVYYYANWRSQRLAGEVLAEVVSETKAVNRGVKEASFFLLRHALCPAVHLECGFLTNPGEYAKLASPAYRERIAFGIFRGIRTYLETASPAKIVDKAATDRL
ncbi:MAG: N-acetylmuramoyl-L-alanine amidase [Firmicutes bacterium]|nr:N-acetylmuramoyl-L-alanine amidase [Bacillota bacterium]